MRTVATAGHVDHGKSSLVLALTGTDPDRLLEEKARGLTIDLGYAFTTLPSGRDIGFVDVPGHVRFLKNTLAGVGAVDVALLVIAADDGWMPQTEEHLQLLELLGVTHGVVAITKSDAVDTDTLELAALLVGDRLAATSWARAPVVLCDSVSGRGLDRLRAALDEVLADAPPPRDTGRPRLWVDRVFAARGAGTVVTGTLAGGPLGTGDDLVVARTGQQVRIRAIETGHRSTDAVAPGARVALNVVGVEQRELERGDALVRAGDWVLASVVDVELATIDAAGAPVAESAPRARPGLLAYVGSGEHHVTEQQLNGAGRYARLRFDVVLALAPGDHIVLRDSGRARTVGGATVLDVGPTTRPRDAAAELGRPLGTRLLAAHGWLTSEELARRSGLGSADADALIDSLQSSHAAVRVADWLVAADTIAALRVRTFELVEARHREQPLAAGLELATLARALELDAARARALVATDDQLTVDRDVVALAGRVGSAAATDAGAALVRALDASPFAPPADALTNADPALVRALVREGVLADIDGVVFSRTAVDRARDMVRGELSAHGEVTVGTLRDNLASTRKYAVALLEQFDREGITRRRGDTRVAGPAA
ncbi:MAG: selenocysteine-specific translation elongation factor [Acidimicrobiia bacterium]